MSRASADTRFGRRLRERTRHGGDQRIGIDERALAEAGIVRVGRLTAEQFGLPECEGTVIDPRLIVWCTGFEPDYGWIQLPVFGSDGFPRHRRGIASDAAGLYFVGLRFQHRMTSSLIGGVGADAEFIAEQMVRRCSMDAAA